MPSPGEVVLRRHFVAPPRYFFCHRKAITYRSFGDIFSARQGEQFYQDLASASGTLATFLVDRGQRVRPRRATRRLLGHLDLTAEGTDGAAGKDLSEEFSRPLVGDHAGLAGRAHGVTSRGPHEGLVGELAAGGELDGFRIETASTQEGKMSGSPVKGGQEDHVVDVLKLIEAMR